MPAHSYVVLIAFTFLLIMLIVQFIRSHRTGPEFLGKPTIDRIYFYTGKVAIFTSWALFMVKAVSPGLGYLLIPAALSWTATGMLCAGVLIMTAAMMNLGTSLSVGLPGQPTGLQTHGVYRFSRNPLYAGVLIIAIASCLYFPDLVNVSLTIYGIYIHHRIIREEERFLSEQYGNEWLVYSENVNRYI